MAKAELPCPVQKDGVCKDAQGTLQSMLTPKGSTPFITFEVDPAAPLVEAEDEGSAKEPCQNAKCSNNIVLPRADRLTNPVTVVCVSPR